MKNVVYSNACARDLLKMAKRGKDLSKLHAVVHMLASDLPLLPKHKPHPLKGVWKPKWDCHIEPDWILIYETTEDAVKLVRTGTHSDLF